MAISTRRQHRCVASYRWTSMRVAGRRSVPATPSSPMLKRGYLASTLRVSLSVRSGCLGGAVAADPHRAGRSTAQAPHRSVRRGWCVPSARHRTNARPRSARRKTEYLHAVADAALDGALDGATLRAMDPVDAVEAVRQVKGLGPFAAELVVVRGANAPDALPRNERRLEAEVAERYGSSASLETVADTWRPFRSWAAVHLRVLREERTHEIGGSG